ncbi:IS256 family transposase [Flavobacteriaceae bacterium AH-315-O20]|nr:IS256 family transposase [Flavobacteriaceae bacterium AH-315-O20]
MIELTKVQLQASLNKLLEQENGLTSVLEMTLNGLMYSERTNYLEQSSSNKGNGYRKAFAVGMGKQIELRIPRDRLGLFQPMVLALIRDQKQQLEDLSFELYGNGLTTSQIGSIMKKIYGKYYSKSAISNITLTFYNQMQSWRERPLEAHYLAVYIDAIHLKVRRATVSSEAFYVLLGVKEDYTREVIGIVNIPSESASGWKEVLQTIKDRGVEKIGLIISDNLTGLDRVIPLIFKDTAHQKCVVHLKRSILNKVAAKHKEEVATDLREVFDLDLADDNITKAFDRLNTFSEKWRKNYKHIGNLAYNEMNELYFTYTNYHPKIRRMIYTTNWVERLNKEFRRTFKIRNSMPNFESALTLLSKVAMDKEDGYFKYPIYNFKFDKKLNE